MPCPAASQEARWGWAGMCSERQKVLWGPWDRSGQAHRVDHVNGGWRHGDSDHWPKAFQPGFIQPRGLEHSPGAIPRGAHAHPGDYHGEDEETGSQLSVRTPAGPFPFLCPFPYLSRAWVPSSLGESTNIPQSFLGCSGLPAPSSHPEFLG